MGCKNSKPDVDTPGTGGAALGNPIVKQRSVDVLEHKASAILERAKRKKRQVIQDSAEVDENFSLPEFDKSDAVKTLLAKVLKNKFFMFETLNEEQKEPFIMAFESKSFTKAGEEIIKEGDKGDFMYIVEQGTFEAHVKGKGLVATMDKESLFGELALIYDAPRAASIVLKGSSAKTWRVNRQVFRYIAKQGAQAASQSIVESLRRMKLFGNAADESMLTKLADAMEPTNFSKGDVIIEQGAQGDIFYLLKEGTVKCVDNKKAGQREVVLSDGDYFGELALLNDKPRMRDVIVTSEKCVCYMLARNDFLPIFGSFQRAMIKELGYRVLRGIPELEKLPNTACREMAMTLKIEKKMKGEHLMKQGEKGDCCYIIIAGMVSISVDGVGVVVPELKSGSIVGEVALLDNSPRTATVTATVDGTECFVLTREEFNKRMAMATKVMSNLESLKKQRQAMLKSAQPPKLNEMEQHILLGTGTFGRVWLVTDKNIKDPSKKVPYALKTMKKKQIVEFKLQKNIVYEAEVQKMCHHPFILHLISTYQDQHTLYMLLEFVQGGELFSLLSTYQERGKHLAPEQARMYAASVLDAFIYLHSMEIIYRDLKPENLLLDTDGYIRVVDFGFAKQVPRGSKTFTLCGTPEYLAPEVAVRKGHNTGADYWGIGILIFEMMTGSTPFVDPTGRQDTRVVINNILRKDISFPSGVDKSTRSLIMKLLNRNPSKRLGCLEGGGEQIRDHVYFDKFNFDQLRSKEMPVFWKPKVKSKLDTSNFDLYDDEDDEGELKYRGTQDWCASFGEIQPPNPNQKFNW